MEKNVKRVMVTGGTKSDVAAMAVFVMNVKKTNGHLFSKIIIFHDGISAKDQEKINEIMETEFVYYKLPFSVKNDIIINYFSPMLFCKYECFQLLDKYDEVVWSDYDVVIQEPLDEICQYRSGSYINIVADENKTIRDMFYKEINTEEIFEFDLGKEGLCTPLFSISSKIGAYHDMYEWCYQKTQEYEAELKLAEQCIFSLLVQKFHIAYTKLDPKVYACHPRDSVGKEKILHSYGQPKFWNGLDNEEWNSLYRAWIKMGGTRYWDIKKKFFGKVRLLLSRIMGIRSRYEE